MSALIYFHSLVYTQAQASIAWSIFKLSKQYQLCYQMPVHWSLRCMHKRLSLDFGSGVCVPQWWWVWIGFSSLPRSSGRLMMDMSPMARAPCFPLAAHGVPDRARGVLPLQVCRIGMDIIVNGARVYEVPYLGFGSFSWNSMPVHEIDELLPCVETMCAYVHVGLVSRYCIICMYTT